MYHDYFATRLTNNSAADDDIDWSPDGTKIAFRSKRDGNAEVYAMNANGTGVTRLTNNSASDSSLNWSYNGTSQTRITNHSATDQRAAW